MKCFHNSWDFTAQLSSNIYKYCDLRKREEAIVSPELSFLKLEIVILYEKLMLCIIKNCWIQGTKSLYEGGFEDL